MIPEVRTPLTTNEKIGALRSSILEGESLLESFEKDFAQYIAVPHARCVYSGRDGLFLILKALRFRPGDKVIVPAYTSPIVSMVLLNCGLKPVYSRVSSATFNLSVDGFEKMIDRNTKAVIPIHMFGNPCQMDELKDIAQAYDIVVIEDAAQALGAEYRGKKVGSFGDVGLFSFGRGKNITMMGGGMVVSKRADLIAEIDALVPKAVNYSFKNWAAMLETLSYSYATSPRVYNFSSRLWNLVRGRYSFDETHFRKEITSYQAALGKTLLSRLDRLNDKRIANANYVINALTDAPWLSVQQSAIFSKHVYLRLVVKHSGGASARKMTQRNLFKYGFDVPTLEGYCPLNFFGDSVYNQEVRRTLIQVKQEITDRTLALPTNPDLSVNDLETLVWILKHSG